ncbi:Gamma-glutamyltranspeptidase family-containing protein [Strongyloides ratti]|uniref:Gamma-glutamyltranspeptidase family-containing protein n=1 Tax=Strongyloides ratti TaxID=34506 RepID=A0A090LGS7_STRRB|nr:Gamma-glutamyltranspeptidase family-containing protein [Strongyloides ratti]CEF69006.1 Gamma-glutamyltranspeptidase family-containing protein [Strongyloides ratti]
MVNKTADSNTFNTFGEQSLNNKKYKRKLSCFKWLAIIAVIVSGILCLLVIALALVVGVKINQNKNECNNTITNNNCSDTSRRTTTEEIVFTTTPKSNEDLEFDWPKPSGSLFARYKKAAVTSDNGLCSEIGRDILLKGGNAVDSAIATLLCIGVVNPQSSGLGGGFIMTIYDSKLKKCISLDAREMAPSEAKENMFVKKPLDSFVGWKSIGVPGELHGLWTAYTKYGSGKVNWTTLFEPSIALAKDGFPVTAHLAVSLQKKKTYIMDDDDMKKMFTNKKTGRLYEEGDFLKRPLLANTLLSLATAENPVDLFYNQGIAQTISEEIKENGGYVSKEDLGKYETVIYDTPIEVDGLPGGLTMCGPPPPSSFLITQAIVMVMNKFYNQPNLNNLNDPLFYHRLIEIEKFAYSQRTKLGDKAFVSSMSDLIQNLTDPSYYNNVYESVKNISQPIEYYSPSRSIQAPDHGTSHITIIDSDGNGVSCTSTVNQLLGSVRASPTLGIIWNDQMDDFSSPGLTNSFGYTPSSSNFIKAGKRPMSSASPTIIYHKESGEIKMSVGASGGSYIISATAQVIIRSILFNQTVKEAVDAPRFHHQYLPYVTEYELFTPNNLIKILENNYKQNMTGKEKLSSAVQILEKNDNGYIYGNSDFRREIATYPTGY